MAKKVKVVERKLGREGVVGFAYFDENLIEIDPNQSPYEWMETIIHERMHLMFPKMSEKEITTKAHDLATFLWDLNFRRTYNEKKK